MLYQKSPGAARATGAFLIITAVFLLFVMLAMSFVLKNRLISAIAALLVAILLPLFPMVLTARLTVWIVNGTGPFASTRGDEVALFRLSSYIIGAIAAVLIVFTEQTSEPMHPFYKASLVTAFYPKRFSRDEDRLDSYRDSAKYPTFISNISLQNYTCPKMHPRVKERVWACKTSPLNLAVTARTVHCSVSTNPEESTHLSYDTTSIPSLNSISTAMAISGAAASVEMGPRNNLSLTSRFLMAFSGFDTAKWVPFHSYPGGLFVVLVVVLRLLWCVCFLLLITASTNSPTVWGTLLIIVAVHFLLNLVVPAEWYTIVFACIPILRTLRLATRNRISNVAGYLYLTDGGHADNLGLVEMLAQRCELIFVCASEQEPNKRHHSLQLALSYAESHYGIKFRFLEGDDREWDIESIAKLRNQTITSDVLYQSKGRFTVIQYFFNRSSLQDRRYPGSTSNTYRATDVTPTHLIPACIGCCCFLCCCDTRNPKPSKKKDGRETQYPPFDFPEDLVLKEFNGSSQPPPDHEDQREEEVRYVESDSETGIIVYMHATLSSSEEGFLKLWALNHQDFPNTPTSKQQFQWDEHVAYRRLGKLAFQEALPILQRFGTPSPRTSASSSPQTSAFTEEEAMSSTNRGDIEETHWLHRLRKRCEKWLHTYY